MSASLNSFALEHNLQVISDQMSGHQRIFNDEDFLPPVVLEKEERDYFILFFSANEESLGALNVWGQVVDIFPGYNFGVCNLSVNKKVGEMIGKVTEMGLPVVLFFRETLVVREFKVGTKEECMGRLMEMRGVEEKWKGAGREKTTVKIWKKK